MIHIPTSTAAILLMASSTFFLSVMQALVRHLGQEIHSFQITFVASATGVVLLIAISLISNRQIFSSNRKGMLVVRGILLAFSNIVFFFGLTLTPLVEATSISFVGVVFAVLVSVVLLGERLYFHRWVAIVATFVGIVAILRPGYIEPNLGVYAVLISSLTWGLALVVAKVLSRTETPLVILAWSLLITTVVSALFAYAVWTSMSALQLWQSISIGLLGTVGHLFMTKSLQMYDATVVVPINCTRLVWAAVIGLLVFQEFPDFWTIIGSILIVFSIIYLSRTEMKQLNSPN